MFEAPLVSQQDDWIDDGFVIPDEIIEQRLQQSPDARTRADVVRNVDVPVPAEIFHYVRELARCRSLLVLVLNTPNGNYSFRPHDRSRIYIDPDAQALTKERIHHMESVQVTQISWNSAA